MRRRYGEGLTVWSWLQLGGFVILSIGMLMFNGTIKCGGKKEESENKALLLPTESAPKKTTFGNSTTKKTDRSLTLREMKSESNI